MRKRQTPTALNMLAGTVLGFGIAVSAWHLLGRKNTESADAPRVELGSSVDALEPPISGIRDSLAEFEKLPARERLRISAETRTLEADERIELLDQAMELSVEDRKSLLAVLVLQWSAIDPEAATLWCRDHLSGTERISILADAISDWARRDAMAAVRWWAKEMPIDVVTDVGFKAGFRAIAKGDPVALATYFDSPPIKGYLSIHGFFAEDMLQDPAELERLSTAIVGKIGYTDDPDPFSSGRTIEGKSGWNELFEKVALEKYQLDPTPTFERWLDQFPENAQNVIRERIRIDGERAARKAAEEAADPAELTAPALVRDDLNFVPTEESFPRAQQEWAEWWRSDRSAAEAFLEASVWPGELKFRARAAAYTQEPNSLRQANAFFRR